MVISKIVIGGPQYSGTVVRKGVMRSISLRTAGAGAAAVLLVAAVTAAVFAQPGRSSSRGAGANSTLTWALPATIRSLDYIHSAEANTATVVALGQETLVQYDQKTGALRPNLAISWSQPNALTYVYKIRRGVKFWDGNPLTAADVAFSLGENIDPKVGSQIFTFYTSVKSIKATGPDTVVVKLKTADPFFRFAPAVTFITEKAFALAHKKDFGTPGVLVMGTGPFKFTNYTPGESVSLDRFDGYWGKKPALQHIVIKFITDDATRLLAMRSGEIDGAFSVPLAQISQWQRVSGVNITTAPELRTGYLSIDTADGPFRDVHVRRAIAYSFDKSGMVHAILHGYGAAAPAMPPPEQWAGLIPPAQVHRLYASLPQYRFSLQKAKAELAQSKYPNGFSTSIPVPDGEPTLGQAAQALAQNLAKIGIKLTLKQISSNAWFNIIYTHPKPLGLQIISFAKDYPDPADMIYLTLYSKYAVKNSFNTANYKNAIVDRAFNRQRLSTKPAVRAAAIATVLRQAAKDVPYVPFWYQDIAMAMNSNKFSYRGFGTWYLYQPWARNIVPKS